MLPDIIIAGVGRCGTTSLFRYLAAHPDICITPRKEEALIYRIPGISKDQFVKYYQDNVTCEKGNLLLEASPQYVLNSAFFAPRLAEFLPKAKILFMLRDPVQRLYSVYRAVSRRIFLGEDFSIYIQQSLKLAYGCNVKVSDFDDLEKRTYSEIYRGNYWPLLEPYFKSFGTDRIFIGFLEILESNPVQFMENLTSFLGLEGEFYQRFTFTRENPAPRVRWPGIYRLALNINMALEPYLNRAPGVRRMLRTLHFWINKPQGDTLEELSFAREKYLDDFYREANRELRSRLEELFPDILLPEWLLE